MKLVVNIQLNVNIQVSLQVCIKTIFFKNACNFASCIANSAQAIYIKREKARGAG